MLYVVPTPIGNLEDITLRALKVLDSVELILAEDTRTTGKLLKKYNIETPMRPYHTRNEHQILSEVIEILRTQDIALVSDAGTPAISDPGFLLLRACREEDIIISCLPGANAIIPAIVMSGIPCDKFHFEGFLPHKKGRNTRLGHLSKLETTFVLYESPHRVIKTLEQLSDICGSERPAALIKEISKLHESYFHGTLSEIADKMKKISGRVRGEYVLVVQGA